MPLPRHDSAPRATCALLLAATGAIGCAQSAIGPLGEFTIELKESSGAIAIRHKDGLELMTIPSGAFAFRRADATYEMQFGSYLIKELPRSEWVQALRFKDAKREEGRIALTLLDGGGQELGKLMVRLEGKNLVLRAAPSDGKNNRASLSLRCDDPSAGGFLGFGSQTYDVDHRGQVIPVWVSEDGIGKVTTDEPSPAWFLVGTRHQSYLSVPTMLAPRAKVSFGLHSTTLYRSIWDLCATDPSVLRIEVWQGAIEVAISPGPSPLDVIEEQTSMTGRVLLGPDWTYGVWMERIGGSDAVRDEARRLREARIPASAIWSEDWRGAKRQGNDYVLEENWRWDQGLYPALPDLIGELHGLGFKFMSYANTFVVQGKDVWAEAVAGGHLVKDLRDDPYMFPSASPEPSGLADLFRPESRQWVQKELERALSIGADGWMGDFGEWYPADPRTVRPSDGSDPEAAHHRYAIAWNEVNQAARAASGRGDDVVIFQRTGYTGSQGKLQVLWCGDQRTDFQVDDGLPTIIPMLMGLGVTGFPIVTHDIPGYISATNPPATKELFFRWTTLGALDPVMRTHHGRTAFSNWRWSSDQETIEHFRRWADFHTRFFPLWKGLAQQAHETGAPILRPLALFDPGNVAVHGVRDEYLIGDALLVAPVVTASTAARSIVLPRGVWYDFFTAEAVSGPATIRRDVPLGDAPIFARAGAIVPLLPEGVESLAKATSGIRTLDDARFEREVLVWLGADGAMRDGEGGAYALKSSGRPAGAVQTIEGALSTVESSARRAVVTATPGSTVALVAADGTRHELATRGIDPRMKLRIDFRW